MKKLQLFFFALLIFSVTTIYAQRANAEALLSRNNIRIGEQTELTLAVRYHEGTKKSVVTWPEFHDTIAKGIDIVSVDTIHTKLASRSSVLYEQSTKIIVTVFDSGMYIIPPQKFIVDNDTVETLPLELYVLTVAVDTSQAIKDIKDIYTVPPPPIMADTNSPHHWWWWAIGGFALIATIMLILYLTRKKKNLPVIPSFTRQLLPHEKVLEQLAELGRRKPWMHGELREYHIAMTEILRAWIVERYHIHAREMTTGEIISTLHSKRVDSSAVMKLERVLRTADMVKFAKGIPEMEENESCLQLAMNFVEGTAIYPEPQLPIPQAQ